jgi:DNA-binding NarL/FixJ family response regulator
MPARIRILLVDDHDSFRHALRQLLRSNPNFDVVGEATDGETAVQLASQLSPDVVLMDSHMPGLGGIEATRQIRTQAAAPRVLGLSSVTSSEADELVKAGAERVVHKATAFDELIAAILCAEPSR